MKRLLVERLELESLVSLREFPFVEYTSRMGLGAVKLVGTLLGLLRGVPESLLCVFVWEGGRCLECPDPIVLSVEI